MNVRFSARWLTALDREPPFQLAAFAGSQTVAARKDTVGLRDAAQAGGPLTGDSDTSGGGLRRSVSATMVDGPQRPEYPKTAIGIWARFRLR